MSTLAFLRNGVLAAMVMCFAARGLADASRTILDYGYGNQISRSLVSILEDGTVIHQEKASGGGDLQTIDEARLSARDAAALQLAIAGASQGEQEESEGGATTLGSSSGWLVVYDRDRQQVNIHSIKRGDRPGDRNTVTKNQAPESYWILSLVNRYAKRKMPL